MFKVEEEESFVVCSKSNPMYTNLTSRLSCKAESGNGRAGSAQFEQWTELLSC